MGTIAFENTQHTKASAIALAQWHTDHDRFVSGDYGKIEGEGWRGCSVGCMASGKNHSQFPKLFGIDVRIAYLADRIFEGLSQDSTEQKEWTLKLFSSVREGRNTTQVWYQFAHFLLVDPEFGVSRFNNNANITKVVDLCKAAANGDVISSKQWQAALAAVVAVGVAYSVVGVVVASDVDCADYADCADCADYAYSDVDAAVFYAAVAYVDASAQTKHKYYNAISEKLCELLAEENV